MWRWARWVDRATARGLGPVLTLSGGLHRVHLQGDAASTWSRLSPWCSVWIEPMGFSFSSPGREAQPYPQRPQPALLGQSPPPTALVWYKQQQKPSEGDWQVGGLAGVPPYAWTRILLARHPPPPEAGVVEGRETKIHSVFLEPFTPWLLPALAPSQSLPFAPSPLPSPSQKCSGSPLDQPHSEGTSQGWNLGPGSPHRVSGDRFCWRHCSYLGLQPPQWEEPPKGVPWGCVAPAVS